MIRLLPARIDGLIRSPPTPRFRALILLSAVTVLTVGLIDHAMWRDEIQAWLIVRDSHGLADLVRKLRYEGHPLLWYLLLLPFSAFGRAPHWMQVAQWLTASATLGLIVFRGPFARLELLLLPFGYELLFEYGVKSRSYALGNLLFLGFCAAYPQRRQHPVALAVVLALALLANVHALFAIIACACACAMVFDRMPRPRCTRWDALAAGVFLAGLSVTVATAHPPADSGIAMGWHFDVAWAHLVVTLRSFSGVVYESAGREPLWAAVAGVMLIGIALARWRRAPDAAVLLAVATFGLAGFFHVKYGPGPWHHGMLFMVLLGAVWISRDRATAQGHGLLPQSLFLVLLACQAVNGWGAISADAVRPYSNGRAVARFIEASGWARAPIFALDDTIASTVVGYLGVDHVFYAQGARAGSFIIWDQKRRTPIDLDAFFNRARNAEPAPTILDCGPLMRSQRPVAYGYAAVAVFDGSLMGEDCTVYRRAVALPNPRPVNAN
jgi:hypothetical protein